MKIIFLTRQPKNMNLKFALLKLIPLITSITVLFPTTNIAKAASAPVTKTAPTPEILKEELYAAGGHSTEGHSKSAKISKILLSEKAKKIKFFAFLGLITVGIFAPEIFYKPKKNKKSLGSDKHLDTNKTKPKVVEPDMEFLKAISAKTQDVDLFADNLHSTNGKVERQPEQKSA